MAKFMFLAYFAVCIVAHFVGDKEVFKFGLMFGNIWLAADFVAERIKGWPNSSNSSHGGE